MAMTEHEKSLVERVIVLLEQFFVLEEGSAGPSVTALRVIRAELSDPTPRSSAEEKRRSTAAAEEA